MSRWEPPPIGYFYLGAMLGSILLGVLGILALAARDNDRRAHAAELRAVVARYDSIFATPCQFTPQRTCVYPLTPRDTIRRGSR